MHVTCRTLERQVKSNKISEKANSITLYKSKKKKGGRGNEQLQYIAWKDVSSCSMHAASADSTCRISHFARPQSLMYVQGTGRPRTPFWICAGRNWSQRTASTQLGQLSRIVIGR